MISSYLCNPNNIINLEILSASDAMSANLNDVRTDAFTPSDDTSECIDTTDLHSRTLSVSVIVVERYMR
jgi:hypothetical protein